MLLPIYVVINLEWLALISISMAFILILVLSILINKKFYFYEFISYTACVLIRTLFLKQQLVYIKVIYVLILISLCLVVFFRFLLFSKKKDFFLAKTNDFLLNSECDMYFQIDNKGKIKNLSPSVLKVTNMTKKAVLNVKFSNFIKEHFEIIKIDNEIADKNTINNFLNSIANISGKHFNYQAVLEINFKPKTSFQIVLTPIIYRNKLIAKNIYFYIQKLDVINTLRSSLSNSIKDLDNSKQVLNSLMNLSSEMCFFYDFTINSYIVTNAFKEATSLEKNIFSGEEYFNLIHQEDLDGYLEQTHTINSLYSIRLRYRLKIGNDYYNVCEDAILLTKDDYLVSIVRIIENVSQKERIDLKQLIDNLSKYDMTKLIERVGGLLEVKDEKN